MTCGVELCLSVQLSNRFEIERCLRNERRHVEVFREFRTIGASFGAVIVVASRSQAIYRGNRFAEEVPVADAAALFDGDLLPERLGCFPPNAEQRIAARVSWPRWARFREVNTDLARKAVAHRAHVAGTLQGSQSLVNPLLNRWIEASEFTFGHGFVGHAVEASPSLDGADVHR